MVLQLGVGHRANNHVTNFKKVSELHLMMYEGHVNQNAKVSLHQLRTWQSLVI
jgi:hypothetical protein